MEHFLIGLGGKLLEGFFANRAAKQQRAQSVDDVKQQFVRLREGAELAGFNPLAVLGTASGIPAQAGSGAYMGTALADSALMIADSLARSKKAGTLNKVNALEAENRDLLGRLTAMTLRPKVPGVYEQRAANAATVVDPGPYTGGSGLRGPAGSLALRPIPNTYPLDERRSVLELPVPSDPGFAMVDNPGIEPFAVPTVNGELVGVTEAPVVGGAYLWDRFNRLGRFATAWIPDERDPEPDGISLDLHPTAPPWLKKQGGQYRKARASGGLYPFNPPAMGRTVSRSFPLGF